MKKESKDIFQYVLGGLVTLGFFALLVILMYKTVPFENKDLLTLVIGALLGSFTTIVAYFFGSSKGSSEKTEMLNKNP